MESIGEKLKKIREERGYTLDQVARDTHITKRYIQAIEEETFDQFPGESYLLGFLRNYSNYLGQDEQEIVGLYKNMRLQEQPAPITELLDHTRSRRNRRLLYTLIILLLFAAGAAIIYLSSQDSPDPSEQAVQAPIVPVDPATPSQTVVFSGDFLEQSFSADTRIQVNLPELQGNVDLIGFDQEQAAIRILGEVVNLGILDAALVDITGDGQDDLRIITKGTADTLAGDPGVIIRVDRFIQLPAAQAPVAAAAPVPARPGESVSGVGTTQVPSRILATRNIVQQATRTPIRTSLTFAAPTLLRYQTDDGRTQELFGSVGQTIEVSTGEWIRIWAANGGAIQARFLDNLVRLSSNGEVFAGQIGWADVAEGQTQRLQLLPMY